jgi:CRP/FNR family transcriptional regulator, cyclic AMP receptor protein
MVNSNLFLNLFRSKTGTEYKAGQTIIETGTTGQSMFVVVEGEVEVRVGDKRIDVVGPGSIFGEMALIDDTPRSATVIAETDCRLVEVDRKRFEFMVSETPFFALAVMRVMADRLRKANTKAAGPREPLSTMA